MGSRPSAVYVGIKGAVVAIDRASGKTIWQTELKGSDFVSVTLQDGDLFAASRGRLYRLDPTTGDMLWSNDLEGLGYGIVSIAGASQVGGAAETQRRAQAAAAAAAAS